MYSSVEFTICVGGGACQNCTGVATRGNAQSFSADVSPIGVTITMRIAESEIPLGPRPLNLTLNDILDQMPAFVPDAAEDVFSSWLWRDNVKALRIYRDALEHSEEFPPRVAWRLCAPPGVSFPELPVEAMLGARMDAPVVFRQVDPPVQPAAPGVGSFLPPVGVWTVAPVAFMPHRLLPQLRDVMAECDAIARRRLPTIDVLDVEYTFTRDRLRRFIISAGQASIQVLHIIADIDRRTGRLKLADAMISASEFAAMFAGANWSELQTIVISAFDADSRASTFTWDLLQLLPIASAVTFQGEIDLRNALYPFMETFYGALAAGLPIDNAVARARMRLRENEEVGAADVLAPVIFMRGDRDVPEIRIGDPAVESILAATYTIAAVRDTLEDPDVVRIAEDIPEKIAHVHADLQNIGEEHIGRLRRMRIRSERVLRDSATVIEPAQSAAEAVSAQLRKVLDMAPAPSYGGAASAPPGIDWSFVVRRASANIGTIELEHPLCFTILDKQARPWQKSILACDADGTNYRLCILDGVKPNAGDGHAANVGGNYSLDVGGHDAPDAVINTTVWPPIIATVEPASATRRDFFARFERLMGQAAAATIRDILYCSFAGLLGQQQSEFCPPGFAPDDLLRGAFHALGIRFTDIPVPQSSERMCPEHVYFVNDLDVDYRIVVAVRATPQAQVEGAQWDALRDSLQTENGGFAADGTIFLDPWPVSGVEDWINTPPFFSDTAGSWVWKQLPQAMSDYRARLVKRLWEWWIGALPPEVDDA